jgi:hypothetical protein
VAVGQTCTGVGLGESLAQAGARGERFFSDVAHHDPAAKHPGSKPTSEKSSARKDTSPYQAPPEIHSCKASSTTARASLASKPYHNMRPAPRSTAREEVQRGLASTPRLQGAVGVDVQERPGGLLIAETGELLFQGGDPVTLHQPHAVRGCPQGARVLRYGRQARPIQVAEQEAPPVPPSSSMAIRGEPG